jgi:hypothetical protein
VASRTSASGATSFTPATPRNARTRFNTFVAVSTSPDRVVSNSSPAAMFDASVARKLAGGLVELAVVGSPGVDAPRRGA